MQSNICQQFKTFLWSHSSNEKDIAHSRKILDRFEKQTWIDTMVLSGTELLNLVLDCHGFTTDDVYWILEFFFHCVVTPQIQSQWPFRTTIWITGIGRHSKKPLMDYYLSTQWKNPLHNYIREALVSHGLGARIRCEPGRILYQHIPNEPIRTGEKLI